jgi:hypothetical protein
MKASRTGTGEAKNTRAHRTTTATKKTTTKTTTRRLRSHDEVRITDLPKSVVREIVKRGRKNTSLHGPGLSAAPVTGARPSGIGSQAAPTTLALVQADLKTLLAQKTVTETDVMMMIRKWEDGALQIKDWPEIKKAVLLAVAKNATKLSPPAKKGDLPSLGGVRLLAYANGRGGGGVLATQPMLEKTNLNPSDKNGFAVYRYFAGKAFLKPDGSAANLDAKNDHQGDEGDCWMLAVEALVNAGLLHEMVLDQVPLEVAVKMMLKWKAQGIPVLNEALLLAAHRQLQAEKCAQGSIFFVRFFQEIPDSDFGSLSYLAADHEFPVDPGDPAAPATARDFAFAKTEDMALNLQVWEKGMAIGMGTEPVKGKPVKLKPKKSGADIPQQYNNGSWASIDGGDSSMAMLYMTGVKGQKHQVADLSDQQLYAILKDAFGGPTKRFVTMGTFAGKEDSKAAKFLRELGAPHVDHPMPGGVIPSHEYSEYFDVKTTTDPKTGETRYWLKLRNPWGDTIPTDLDPDRPTPEPGEEDKGIFWYEFKQVRACFEDMDVQRFPWDEGLKGTPPAWALKAIADHKAGLPSDL